MMPTSLNPWGAVLALHLLCAGLWVGGMAVILLVVRPSLGALDPAQRTAVTSQVLRRFFLFVWHAMPLLLLSGYAMLFGYYDGFAGVNWSVHAMHALGLLMALVFLYVFFGPWPKFRAAVSPQRAAASAERIRKLVLLNLVLGVVTIVVAGLGAL